MTFHMTESWQDICVEAWSVHGVSHDWVMVRCMGRAWWTRDQCMFLLVFRVCLMLDLFCCSSTFISKPWCWC